MRPAGLIWLEEARSVLYGPNKKKKTAGERKLLRQAALLKESGKECLRFLSGREPAGKSLRECRAGLRQQDGGQDKGTACGHPGRENFSHEIDSRKGSEERLQAQDDCGVRRRCEFLGHVLRGEGETVQRYVKHAHNRIAVEAGSSKAGEGKLSIPT